MIYLYHVNTFTYHELKDRIVIGRTHGDLVFSTDGRMSGRHAQITLDLSSKNSGAVVIEDLGSKNLSTVNRAQLVPQRKTRVSLLSLIEVGSQHFIVTDNQSMKLETLNGIMDTYINRPIIKIDRGSNPQLQTPTQDPVTSRERLLAEAIKEIDTLEDNVQIEVMRLDQAKERLLIDLRSKRESIQRKIDRIRGELELAMSDRAEAKDKVRKVIDLKGL